MQTLCDPRMYAYGWHLLFVIHTDIRGLDLLIASPDANECPLPMAIQANLRKKMSLGQGYGIKTMRSRTPWVAEILTD